MKNINNMSELEEQILFLRKQRQYDLLILKNQYRQTVEGLKPLNLVKGALHNVLVAPDLKSSLVKATIGFGTKFLTNRFYDENSINPVKRILSKAIKLGIRYFSKNK